MPLYWLSTAFGITGWNVAASLIAIGLVHMSPISYSIPLLTWAHWKDMATGVHLVRPGVVYQCRRGRRNGACRGSISHWLPCLGSLIYGHVWVFLFIFIRAIIGTIAFDIQTFYGANLLSTCLRCIFGSHWENLANTLPESAHVSSKTLLCFFLGIHLLPGNTWLRAREMDSLMMKFRATQLLTASRQLSRFRLCKSQLTRRFKLPLNVSWLYK